ncbi:TRAP transporter substrate-binding protein [uncultured Castellaniella sp.]|uniref:TRAP transporter substrate-binding protein n=1 Tax=uncultured Castellaniella sp. TaxID=647907 RepID=UPI0026046C62|nr:TRAP transporter substrate-binding protein [uncultured Castellaniella sp.]
MMVPTRIKTFFAAAALGMLTSAGAQAATTWDLPLAWPESNYIVKYVGQFAEEVKQATGGEVQITLHPSGSLGFKGPEMLSAVRDGLVPIGDMLLNQQVGFNPLLGLESLPFMIDDFQGLKDFGKAYLPLLDEIYAANNQKILFRIPWPQQQIYTRKEVKSLDDLQGVKIRSYDRSSTAIFRAIGMSPVQLPWSDVVPALAAGTIDAVATSSPSAVDGSFWELLKYGYPTRQTWNTDVISVNLDAWNSLSEKDRKAIVEVARRLEPEFWDKADANDKVMMDKLAGHGMVNGSLSDAMRAQLRDKAAAIRNDTIAKLGPKAQAVVDAYQKR